MADTRDDDESRQLSWDEFPGPPCYAPREVDGALASLCKIRDKRSANEAYNRVLFAVGNNHRGTLYPAAAAAAPRVLEIALAGEGIVRTTALDVVMDLLLFSAEPGFEIFEWLDGSSADVKDEIKKSIQEEEEKLFGILVDQREQEKDRLIALSILDLVAVDPSRVVSVARIVLAQGNAAQDLIKACRETLTEHDA